MSGVDGRQSARRADLIECKKLEGEQSAKHVMHNSKEFPAIEKQDDDTRGERWQRNINIFWVDIYVVII